MWWQAMRSQRPTHRLLEQPRAISQRDRMSDLEESGPPVELERRARPECDAQEELSYTGGSRPVEHRVDHQSADPAVTILRMDPYLIECGDVGILRRDARPRETYRALPVLGNQRQLGRRLGPR